MKMVFPNARANRTIGDFANDINTLADALFGSTTSSNQHDGDAFTPRMDIYESDDSFVVSLDLPGVSTERLNIALKEDDLVISGSRSSSHEVKENRYSRVERWAGDFQRSLRLPRSVDRDGVTADFNNGVLTLTLPKLKAAASRKIEIRTSSTIASTSEQETSGENP